MSDIVYHFTDTARLPWILQSGELQPSANRLNGYPVDFLWATTDKRGSRSASVYIQNEQYRRGIVRMVRFALHAADFEPWRDIVQRFPAWTPAHIEMLERVAKDSPATWRCRVAPLTHHHWIEIASKTYTDNVWHSSDFRPQSYGRGVWGVTINGRIYASRRHVCSDGLASYEVLQIFDPAKEITR
jgi:hypothetical protein